MATLTRQRVIAATPAAVWEVLTNADTFPRWWPRVTRVENVRETGFTQVLFSRRGRPVRLDLRYTEVEDEALLVWELDIPGSQFERLVSEWATRVSLAPEGTGTRVTIEERQRFRGSFRTGSLLQRRAAARRLEEALEGLGELF